MQRASILTLAVLTGLSICIATPARGEPGAEQLKEEIGKLERRAHELKESGKPEEARAVWREAEELRAKLAGPEKDRGDSPQAVEKRRDALRHALEEARAEVRELREAGKEDRAAEMSKKVQHLEEELARLGPRKEGDRPPEPAEAKEKLQHLRQAIGHLHAAGLHEPAERLSREADGLEQRLKAQAGDQKPAPAAGTEAGKLQDQLQELRQAVRKLNARIDELEKSRR
jgi:chromosome segregation ATPase